MDAQAAAPDPEPEHDPTHLPGRLVRPRLEKRRRRARRGGPARKTTCGICGEKLRQLTPAHVREHGYSLAQYQMVYGQRVEEPPPRAATLATDLAERLRDSPEFTGQLADEVSAMLATGPMRARLQLAVCSLLSVRLAAHAEAVTAFEKVRRELDQPWRREQAGPHATPTETKDLVALGQLLLADVKQGEEMLVKTVKLAIDEAKGQRGAQLDAQLGGFDGARYTGSAEVLPVPPSLSSGERETIRSLMGLFSKRRQPAIEAIATVNTEAPPAPKLSPRAAAQMD